MLPRLQRGMLPDTPLMECLYRALSVKRAAGSLTEAKFVAWLCKQLPVTMIDEAGNIHIDTREGPQHRTMLTAHTDTVHRSGGENIVRYDDTDRTRIVLRADPGSGECLGADDGAGVALIYHMILNGFKGYAVLFRQEEVGGVGSSWLAENMPQALEGIDRCISLDRAGGHDVITHQGGKRCCSDAFADALAAALTTDSMSLCYAADSTGVFTDSANLTRIVAECTNLSVFYTTQHGDGEWQDVTFLQQLAEQLVTVAWDDLPVERKPFEVEKNGMKMSGHWSAAPGTQFDAFDEFLMDALYNAVDGKFAELRGIIAQHLMPEDSGQALPHIRVANVHSALLEAYADGLLAGDYDTYQILDILAQDCLVN